MQRKLIGIIGAVLFALGTFLPIISTPFGSVNFYNNIQSNIEGIIFIMFSVILIFLYYKDDYEQSKIFCAMCTFVSTLDFLTNYFRILGVRTQALNRLNENPFTEIARKMLNVSISWGWIVIFLGCILMIYSSFCFKSICKIDTNNINK